IAAVGDYVRLRRCFFTASALVLTVTLPMAAFLSFGARPIIETAFMRGNFTDDDAALAASVQIWHAWHVPVYILGIVAVRALASISETWILMIGSTVNLLVDFAVNTTLVPVMGVPAVGLATTIMYSASALTLCAGFLIRIGARISKPQ